MHSLAASILCFYVCAVGRPFCLSLPDCRLCSLPIGFTCLLFFPHPLLLHRGTSWVSSSSLPIACLALSAWTSTGCRPLMCKACIGALPWHMPGHFSSRRGLSAHLVVNEAMQCQDGARQRCQVDRQHHVVGLHGEGPRQRLHAQVWQQVEHILQTHSALSYDSKTAHTPLPEVI